MKTIVPITRKSSIIRDLTGIINSKYFEREFNHLQNKF
jgi:hypothetical protein